MKLFKTRKRRIIEESWNLDYEIIKWINEHLKVYLETASKIIDLNYYKKEYGGIVYTQKKAIKRMVELSDKMLSIYNTPDEWGDEPISTANKVSDYKDELYDLLKIWHNYLNW